MNQNSDQLEYAVAAADAMQDREGGALALDALGVSLLQEFALAEADRRLTEERWLKDLRQYRGQYDPDVLALIGPKRSRAFVRKTRVKVKTVDSRVADLLFPAGNDKNYEVAPTPKPMVAPEMRAQVQQFLMAQAQAANQAMQQQMQQAQAQGQQVPPMMPAQVTPDMVEQGVHELVKQASKAMSKTIDDQLTEARYKDVSIKAIHSGHLYGTGVVKGPLVERRVRTRFVKEGGRWVSKSESYIVPFIDFVPLWRWYPDMTATSLEQCRYVYERHTMSRAQLAELTDRKSFRGDVIKRYIKSHPEGEIKLRYYDNEIRVIGERTSTQGKTGGQYEVLERWGWLNGEDLCSIGVKVPEERKHEAFFANVWLLPNGEVIKAVLQPIDGVTWPYHVYYFDKDETSIFGEGLASIMRDDQTMINAATRMMLDNGALTAGPQYEVNPHLLSSIEKVDEIYPHKVWLRNQNMPGSRAVTVVDVPNHIGVLQSMAQTFEQNADEVTAIPRYMSGENASNGAAGTSSGLSMLMGAVNIVIKDLITAWDEGVTVSFIKALYHWNMKFNPDDTIKGDYDVKARGTASLVAKEVRARALNEFAATTANPMDAPFVKRDKLLRARAEVNELSDIVKTEDEVAKEQQDPMIQQQAQLGQQIQAAQLAELQGKAAKLMGEAEVAKIRAQEMLANIELIVARAVESKVGAAYAALQAAGVAVASPHVAPAGDEILRSSGWRDATPNPTMSDLAGPPVQPGQIHPQMQPQVGENGQPIAPQPEMGGAPSIERQTGMVGHQQGIETQEIDG